MYKRSILHNRFIFQQHTVSIFKSWFVMTDDIIILKYFSQCLVKEVHHAHGLEYSFREEIAIDEKTSLDKLFVHLKSRLDIFNRKYGNVYDDMIRRIYITEQNISRQYKNGVDAIFSSFNNQVSPDLIITLLIYLTVMVKTCLIRGLDFIDSLIEWNLKIFKEIKPNIFSLGGWKIILAAKKHQSFNECDKLGLLLFVSILSLIIIRKVFVK